MDKPPHMTIDNAQFHCNQPSVTNSGQSSTKVWRVAIVTAVFMVVEIVYGITTHSLALLADGWHMSTHVVALVIAGLAYRFSARFARDPRYSALFCWGTWKIEILGSFASALLLLGVAGVMAWEAIDRFITPAPIAFDEALIVAVIGLLLNIVSAWMLSGDGSAHHGHSHGHSHGHHGHDHDAHDPADHAHGHAHGHAAAPLAAAKPRHQADLNLRAAYVHVVADAATSVLAIVALAAGRWFGILWLDAAVAIVGAALINSWSIGLLRDSGRVLLDAEMDADVVREVREAVIDDDTSLVDLHVWRVGPNTYSVALSLLSRVPRQPDEFRSRLAVHEEIVHATIEVNLAPA
ncbi:CDF family Co(II)/Ni(II) efflux transporter DmeF [soil metagenome]